MKQISMFKKPISVLLAFCFVLSFSSFSIKAQDGGLSPEEEKAVIEQRIKEANNKLAELEEESAGTMEYLDALNEKIKYLEQEAELVVKEVAEYRKQVDALQLECEDNEKAIRATQAEIEALNIKLEEANIAFDENYNAYCQRLRAIYISGESNVYTFLLSSSNLSQFLTRYEMLRRVAKRDSELLDSIKAELEAIGNTVDELAVKDEALTAQRTELLMAKETLENNIAQLAAKQSELEMKKTNLSAERASANLLLKKLSDEKGYYTEYLEDNREMLDELDRLIEEAARKYAESLTTTTKPTTEPTTAHSESPDDPYDDPTEEHSDGAFDETSGSTEEAGSSRYIRLTYPVPSQTRITCGITGYSGHSGADFACPTGSRVVAAESGTVIVSADLTYADGSYRSYGRYIVIMHDKTTSSGDPVFTLYAHNSSRLVSEGQHVEKGQQIAYSGSTGNSTGPHCHFEVRTPSAKYADCKDPADYLP
ncbi:MAG: peptidoglycan DD-metalloendopeptidase family protein [Eubacterium sp.]|nr:peptidoglycan DD-metalloendopeptidase family protein [Eubacterium sp.]